MDRQTLGHITQHANIVSCGKNETHLSEKKYYKLVTDFITTKEGPTFFIGKSVKFHNSLGKIVRLRKFHGRLAAYFGTKSFSMVIVHSLTVLAQYYNLQCEYQTFYHELAAVKKTVLTFKHYSIHKEQFALVT